MAINSQNSSGIMNVISQSINDLMSFTEAEISIIFEFANLSMMKVTKGDEVTFTHQYLRVRTQTLGNPV